MAIVSGEDILASTWNTYVSGLPKKIIFDKIVQDPSFGGDASSSGEGYIWVRSTGWNWPQFLATHKTGVSYVENEEVALYETPVATEYIIAVRCNNVAGTSATPDPAHADWDLYRYEFGYQSVMTGDEVVYGGGLFTATADADTTPPVIPKYGDIANSDSNYTRSSTLNAYALLTSNDNDTDLSIFLQRPGVDTELEVARYSEHDGTTETTFWLSPGYYRYAWEFTDEFGAGTSQIRFSSKVYDNNVKQWAELRVFNSTLSDHAGKGVTKLLASSMNTTPLCTDFDIDKKGGTASLYTGDWQ